MEGCNLKSQTDKLGTFDDPNQTAWRNCGPKPPPRLSPPLWLPAWAVARCLLPMCIMAILYQGAQDAPILLAANREEYYDRPTQAPRIQSGKPRVICGIDRKAGGTWLGVNQYGLLVTVLNRPRSSAPPEPRSRGLLCREMLATRTAKEAADLAAAELSTGRYAGANYVCLDAKNGLVVMGTNQVEIVPLQPGLHILSDGTMDDYRDTRQQFVRRLLTLHTLDSAVTFLAVASKSFSRKPDAVGRRGVVIRNADYGTVSSTLIALPYRPQNAVYQYAPGPPCDYAYDDLSALLRQVLSAEK
jgi:hypothetical protein